jgi:hypothetical protein
MFVMVCCARQVNPALRCLQSPQQMEDLLALVVAFLALKGSGPLLGRMLNISVRISTDAASKWGFSTVATGKVLGRVTACWAGVEFVKTLPFGFRPPSLPLMRACSLPAWVVGPVDLPP